ncbi:MAG: nucleotidyl transferase AbiEii/AbiGii toxin family protein [Steroidobacteraceae bacterium]
MILQRDISKLANRLYVEACSSIGKKHALRIPETMIERDYCLAWFLNGLARHPLLSRELAFKGGTALRRVHFGEYRFSEDLDFTLRQSLELEAIFAALDEVFQALHAESGIAFRRSPDPPVRHTRNDTFYLIYKGPLPAENSVKVDVTRGETLVFELEQKPIIRTYAEFADLPDDRALLVYSFPEIAVEKTLAVTDDARREPRDLYDLWYIQEAGHCPHPESLVDGLSRKLASRDGRADDVLVPRLERVEKILSRTWENRLRKQVQQLPEFEGCYRNVKRLLADLDNLRGFK